MDNNGLDNNNDREGNTRKNFVKIFSIVLDILISFSKNKYVRFFIIFLFFFIIARSYVGRENEYEKIKKRVELKAVNFKKAVTDDVKEEKRSNKNAEFILSDKIQKDNRIKIKKKEIESEFVSIPDTKQRKVKTGDKIFIKMVLLRDGKFVENFDAMTTIASIDKNAGYYSYFINKRIGEVITVPLNAFIKNIDFNKEVKTIMSDSEIKDTMLDPDIKKQLNNNNISKTIINMNYNKMFENVDFYYSVKLVKYENDVKSQHKNNKKITKETKRNVKKSNAENIDKK
jgi:hypothetical protein